MNNSSPSLAPRRAGYMATALVGLFAGHAQAQDVSGVTIHFGGQLSDSRNRPINGMIDLEVRILDQPIGGNELFRERHQGVAVSNGQLDIDIGSVNAMDARVFAVENGALTGSGRFIGVTIVGDGREMSPRFPIPVIPFAVRSLLGGDGTAGPAGPAGQAGPQGPEGQRGVAGPQGERGAIGPQGLVGPVGAVGASVTVSDHPSPDSRCLAGGVEIVGSTGSVMVCHGAAGAAGSQGDAGPMGPEGPQGRPGRAGADGDSVSVVDLMVGDQMCPFGGLEITSALGVNYVCNGAVGARGAGGPPGEEGPQGALGPVGPQGATGVAGPQGSVGATGAVGPQGLAGADGAVGPQGATGVAGPQGAVGATGVAGPQGAVGPQGPAGLQGLIGADGAMGPQGPAGPAGATGAIGATGTVGAVGPQGPAGTQGVPGPTGATGAVGATGSQGVQGVQGPAGPQGASGGGVMLHDSLGNVLGTVLDASGYGIGIVTSTGHLVFLGWDGTISAGQIYYTGAGCTGTAYLNSGWSQAGPYGGLEVVYSGAFGSLMLPTNLNANGQSPNTALTAAAIDNPTCGNASGTVHGYRLTTTTPGAVGLPSYPLSAPLSLH